MKTTMTGTGISSDIDLLMLWTCMTHGQAVSYDELQGLGCLTISTDETEMYVCRAAVSSKDLSPVFLASKVCSSSSSPMLTCARIHRCDKQLTRL